MPILNISAGGTNITVAKNTALDLAPGSYGDLEVKDGAVLNLSSGTYAFEDIELDKNATLNLDVTNGPIVVGSEDDLTIGKDVSMSSNGTANEILFQVAGNQVKLSQNSVFLGTIVASNAFIDVHKDVMVTGALYGNKVHLKKNSSLIDLPAVRIYFDLYIHSP